MSRLKWKQNLKTNFTCLEIQATFKSPIKQGKQTMYKIVYITVCNKQPRLTKNTYTIKWINKGTYLLGCVIKWNNMLILIPYCNSCNVYRAQ